MNAANILKPALSRGEIQVIGATTFNEYRKHIEKDAALERRFQPVKVEEPSIADCYSMLLGIKEYYENYHKVSISDNLVYKAVTLSERYINDRFLPDKAIDLLDEACTCANLRNVAISDYEKLQKELVRLDEEIEEIVNVTEGEIDYEKLANTKAEKMKLEAGEEELKEKAADNAVTEQDLAKVINLWTGIPTTKIMYKIINPILFIFKALLSSSLYTLSYKFLKFSIETVYEEIANLILLFIFFKPSVRKLAFSCGSMSLEKYISVK